MFQNVDNTQISISSEEDLLAAAGEEKKVDTKGGKGKTTDKKDNDQKTDDKTDKNKSKDKPAPEKKVTALSKTDLEEALGDENDEDEEKDDTEDDNEKVKSKKKGKKATKDDEIEEDDDEDDKDDENDDDKDDDDEEGTTKDDEEDDNENQNEGPIPIKDFLKERVNLLIKKGEWKAFKDWEAVEWDEDAFAAIELKQQEWKRDDIREELLDSFGPYGRDIADYSAKGGNPEDLIDIFREQQTVESFSIDTEEGQREVMHKYATEYLGMKPDKARKYIDSLVADKSLDEDAKEAKTKMEKALKADEQALKDAIKDQEEQQKAKIIADRKDFSNKVTQAVNLMDDVDPDEKKEIIKVLTKFDKKLSNGSEVNDFYFKFAEFRKDLPNYLELVRFVLNPKKYVKTAVNKGKTETAVKDFQLIRTANRSKKTKSGQANSGKDSKKTTFKLY